MYEYHGRTVSIIVIVYGCNANELASGTKDGLIMT